MKKSAPKGKLGSGSRFKAGMDSVASEYMAKGMPVKKAKNIGAAVMAKQGAKKYGQARMGKMAAAGKKK